VDLEAPLRREVCQILEPACECIELAPVALACGHRGQIDVLASPREPALNPYTIAIEVKVCDVVTDRDLGRWIKQAADYVDAIPRNRWPRIAATFIWLAGKQFDCHEEEQLRMQGMIQLAQHFRVGTARTDGRGLLLLFGPSAYVFCRGTWAPKASELLSASRISAGTRRRLASPKQVVSGEAQR